MHKYNVYTQSQHDEITAYLVIKADTIEHAKKIPHEVLFNVNPTNQDIQSRRAKEYCEYLNKIEEAITQAYEQNKLVDILKR